jgi:hypothetical protein
MVQKGRGWDTDHGQDLVVGKACLSAHLELLQLIDPPDDAHAHALPVLQIIFRARSLTSGDLIFPLWCSFQPIVSRDEFRIETPHVAVLILDALCEIGIRCSWDASL